MKAPNTLLLIPDGEFALSGDRTFTLDRKGAKSIIEAFEKQGVDLPIDYEHSTVEQGERGEPAPAAGWIQSLTHKKGVGLVASVKWTPKGGAFVESEEYRYLSPVFKFDQNTGRVTGLHSAALTNKPAIVQQAGLVAARWSIEEMATATAEPKRSAKRTKVIRAAEHGDDEDSGSSISVLAEALQAMEVEIPEDADDGAIIDAAIAFIQALAIELEDAPDSPAPEDVAESIALRDTLRGRLKLASDASREVIVRAVDMMIGHVGYVTAADHKKVADRLATIELDRLSDRVTASIDKLVVENKINPNDDAQMKWARDFAMRDLDGFAMCMASVPSLVAPGQSLVTSKKPTGRSSIIASANREFDADPSIGKLAKRHEYVNLKLREADLNRLTTDEASTTG